MTGRAATSVLGDSSETFPAMLSGVWPLCKRCSERKSQHIFRARGQGWTSRTWRLHQASGLRCPTMTSLSGARRCSAPSWFPAPQKPLPHEFCSWESVRAKQQTIGFTLQEMQASWLPEMKEKASLGPLMKVIINMSYLWKGREVITSPPAIQSHVVSGSFIPGLLFEKLYNHHFLKQIRFCCPLGLVLNQAAKPFITAQPKKIDMQ